MSKKIFYNSSYFKFFRRQLKPIEMEKEFIHLIHSKNNENYPKTDRNIYPKEKNINLDFYFQKHSLILINKIRDLFIEFDEDKSDSFDQNEFFQMFNINKIPIKLEEIIYLFKFNNHKKTITFSELIHLTFDPDFDQRYKEVIEKVKPRCEIGIICPNDFSGMLSHLCEFGKLSSEANKFKKKFKQNKKKKTYKNFNNTSKIFIQSKTKEEVTNENEKKEKGNRRDNIVRRLSGIVLKNEENIKNSNKKLYNRNNIFKNMTESHTDYELYINNENFKKEQDNMIENFKTILEITKKKILRNEKLFKNINYRNKAETSNINLVKSMDILQKINPKLNNTYITYNEINQKFIDLNTGTGHKFKNIENYKYKKLKNNRTEHFSNYKPILTEVNKSDVNKKYNNFFKKYSIDKIYKNKFKNPSYNNYKNNVINDKDH